MLNRIRTLAREARRYERGDLSWLDVTAREVIEAAHLTRYSWGGLEAGLEHDVELGQGGAEGTTRASPATLLQGRDEQSKF